MACSFSSARFFVAGLVGLLAMKNGQIERVPEVVIAKLERPNQAGFQAFHGGIHILWMGQQLAKQRPILRPITERA